MSEAIGIRLEKGMLNKIQKLGKSEALDRSAILRKLISLGYKDLIKIKAAEDYIKGKITLSEASHVAEITIWEMERFLVEQGFKSDYSLEDLKNESRLLN